MFVCNKDHVPLGLFIPRLSILITFVNPKITSPSEVHGGNYHGGLLLLQCKMLFLMLHRVLRRCGFGHRRDSPETLTAPSDLRQSGFGFGGL